LFQRRWDGQSAGLAGALPIPPPNSHKLIVIPIARLNDARLSRQNGGQAVGQVAKRNEESIFLFCHLKK